MRKTTPQCGGSNNIKEQGRKIIEALWRLPSTGYGDYHPIDDLYKTISDIMCYPYIEGSYGRPQYSDKDKLRSWKDRMVRDGIIQLSKTGAMFKLLTNPSVIRSETNECLTTLKQLSMNFWKT